MIRSFLTSSPLRRIGLRLRTRNPRLYSLLNSIRKRVIVGARDVEAYQLGAVRRFAERFPLRGARVLEVGSDLDLRVVRLLAEGGAASVVGVNVADTFPTEAIRVAGVPVELLRADGRRLPFPGESFDAVFSVAALEHVNGLPELLAEIHRLLRSGGMFFAAFGPIWSGGKGHHVRAKANGETAWHAIPEQNPLPDFSHLLLSPEEMRAALLARRVSAPLAEAILEWLYRSPDINRLFHHEYRRIFAASPLRLDSMGGKRDPIDPQLLQILKFRYPGEIDFDVTNPEAILVKSDP